MYFQRKDEYVGFAGKLTDVLNPNARLHRTVARAR